MCSGGLCCRAVAEARGPLDRLRTASSKIFRLAEDFVSCTADFWDLLESEDERGAVDGSEEGSAWAGATGAGESIVSTE